ncbi:MAG: hypothetical protein GXO69_09935 [Acidobacteria bacterium]|nr:hypothetical protein [Acidobacteriota bacterium]
MKCLKPAEMMELLYGETDPATLQKGREHLAQCSKCRNAYWQLKDTRDWLGKNDNREQPVIFILPPPAVKKPAVGLKIAAAAILAILIGAGGFYAARFQKQTETLLAHQQQMEQKLENASFRIQETNRNQYMMVLALKDYLDKNYQTRKVSYEKFR